MKRLAEELIGLAIVIPVVLAAANEPVHMSYLLFAVAGGMAGFARFLRSTKQWKWRVVVSFALFGAIASVAVIGLVFGNDVHANPWKCVAYSLLIGFGQPEFAGIFVSNVLKALGVPIEMEAKQ